MILESSDKQRLTFSTLVLLSLCFLSSTLFSSAFAESKELVSKIGTQTSSSKTNQDESSSKNFLEKLKGIDAQEDNSSDSTEKPKAPITVYEDEDEDEEVDETVDKQSKKRIAKVYLTIAVPHSKNPVIKIKAYPFPPKPEKPSFPLELPEEDKRIKKSLLDSGYMNRTSFDNPFPAGGWRMQYAMLKAKKKSNVSHPHSILEHYRWASKMVKYIKPEFIKINKFESQREARYFKYNSFWRDNHKVLLNKSIRENLEPVAMRPLPRDPKKIGRNFGGVLPPGKWWIKIEYKVRGLAYHWIFELNLKDKDKLVLVANEANALHINGSW